MKNKHMNLVMGIIHGVQVITLLLLGLSIFVQSALDVMGISHSVAMVGSFSALVLSLIIEHIIN